jgi:hypothetical protein
MKNFGVTTWIFKPRDAFYCRECWGDPERELQQCPLFLFTFKDASSSDGPLVSLDRLRQTRQRMLERKPHHQQVAARSKNQKRTRRRESAGF